MKMTKYKYAEREITKEEQDLIEESDIQGRYSKWFLQYKKNETTT